MPVPPTAARGTRHRLRKILPLTLCGPLVAAAALIAGAGQASAQCSVSDGLLAQTSRADRSDSVRCLQASLHDHGVDAGPTDGWFGPVTRSAVIAFQSANGLTVDGWMG